MFEKKVSCSLLHMPGCTANTMPGFKDPPVPAFHSAGITDLALSGSRDLNSGLLDIRHLPSLASHLPKVIILESFVSYNVCALSYRLNKPFMDYGDTVMHGLEASPNAWLQNHAHWGRYLVLPLFTMG